MTKQITVVEEEVRDYQTQVTFVQDTANALEITSAKEMARAGDLLKDLKTVEKLIVEKKQSITRPLMTALASARDLFKPLEIGYAEAKKTINGKMLTYAKEEEQRIVTQHKFVEGRIERGTINQDTAIKRMEKIGEVKDSYTGSTSKTSIKTLRKVRIVDEALIPRSYLEPALKRITTAVLKNNETIPGVEVYSEKSIVSLAR